MAQKVIHHHQIELSADENGVNVNCVRPKQDGSLEGALVVEVEDTSQNPVPAADFLSAFPCQPQGFLTFIEAWNVEEMDNIISSSEISSLPKKLPS